jgi:arginine exporter protein ArgO
MSIDINLLRKGLIRLAILVLLFIATPIITTMGFKGINKFTETPKIYMAYFLVILGFLGIIFTIYFAFKAFSILRKAFFDEN